MDGLNYHGIISKFCFENSVVLNLNSDTGGLVHVEMQNAGSDPRGLARPVIGLYYDMDGPITFSEFLGIMYDMLNFDLDNLRIVLSELNKNKDGN